MEKRKKKTDVKDKRKELNIEDLKKQLKECQRLKDEYLASWQRSRADFLNYKKEEMERIRELLKYASGGLILKILPILDNFEIVEKKIPAHLKNDENPEGKPPQSRTSSLRGESASYGVSIKGLLQIKTQIRDFLKSQGVEEIKCVGKKFDPNFQEVVEEVKKKDKEPGTVIEEVQKGYLLHGKVLRPARVKISK